MSSHDDSHRPSGKPYETPDNADNRRDFADKASRLSYAGDSEKSSRPSREERAPRDSRGGDRPRSPRPSRGDNDSRPPRGDSSPRGPREAREKPQHSVLIDLDKELVRLIARRTRILSEMPKGRAATRIERELRASWESEASKLSRDPRLIRQLFALLQEVECLPRERDRESTHSSDGFGLTPSPQPVDIEHEGPVDCRRTRILGVLAAMSGSACTIGNVLINDPLVELVKAINQLQPCLRWEEDGRLISVAPQGSFGADKPLLDKAVHVGNNMMNFLMVLFAMAVRPCRLKIMGESALKLSDLTWLRHFMPSIGARFTSIVPGQDGLPARLEASGILPESISIPASMPYDGVLALCAGLACAEHGHAITVSLADHPAKGALTAELAELFAYVGAAARIAGTDIIFESQKTVAVTVPEKPELFLDLVVVSVGLAVPLFVGGRTVMKGRWPDNQDGLKMRSLLEQAGIDFSEIPGGVMTQCAGKAKGGLVPDACPSCPLLWPFATLIAVMPALHGEEAILPEMLLQQDMQIVDEFLARVGLERTGNIVRRVPNTGAMPPWSSPNAEWALVLALAAFARVGLKLVNPGIVTEYMPRFWQWYNTLPTPVFKRPPAAESASEQPSRRRIRAGYMPEDQMPEPLAPEEE